MSSQRPVSDALSAAASSVSSTSEIGMTDGMVMVNPINDSISANPHMNVGNSDPVTKNQDTVVPMLNNDGSLIVNHAVLTPSVLHEKLISLSEEIDAVNQSIENLKSLNANQNEIMRLRSELEESIKRKKTDYVSLVSSVDQLSINESATQYSPSRVDATEKEKQLISLVSILLHVHPLGTSFDNICSYLVKMVPTINARDVESLLRRFPNLFEEVSTGIGATLEKKWIYIGLKFDQI